MAQPAGRRFARFVVGLALEDVPAPVATQATLLVLDTLGSCLASAREGFGRAALQAAERLGGPPESTLVGSKTKVAAANAAMANGTLAHGLDFDDTRQEAIVHTGSVTVPTALAVGEALGASGRATLEALIAGVEVMCRVGLAVPGPFHARHYHPTALAGCFAAAATAAKLYALTEEQLVHAFGICGSQAAGIILRDGRIVEERQEHPRGGPDFPMTREELEAKFRDNAGLAVRDDAADRIVRTVSAIASEARLTGLAQSLTT